MKPLSIEHAYLWVQRFIAREWRLLVPVALAFMALPPLIFYLLAPQATEAFADPTAVAKNPAAALNRLAWAAPVQLIIFLFSAAGSLAITALALMPGISVREALALAGRRIAPLVGSIVLAALAEALVLFVILFALVLAGMAPIGIQSIVLGLWLGFTAFIVVRLVPLVPLITQRRIGSVSALRESWVMTAGVFWRVLGAVVIYSLGSLVVVTALTAGLGSILLLFGKAIGSVELGNALSALLVCLLGAATRTGFYLLAAAIYRQLDAPSRGI